MNIKNAFLFLPLLASVESFASNDYRENESIETSSSASEAGDCPMSICSKGTDASIARAFGALNLAANEAMSTDSSIANGLGALNLGTCAMSVCSGDTDRTIVKGLKALNLEDRNVYSGPFASPERSVPVSQQSPEGTERKLNEIRGRVVPRVLFPDSDTGSSDDELSMIIGNRELGGRLSSSSDEISNSDKSLVEGGMPQSDIPSKSASGDGSPRDVPATPAVIKGLDEDSLSSRKRRKVK